MDSKLYLEQSARTMASGSKRTLTESHLRGTMSISYAGNTADRLKRIIFYGVDDQAANLRWQQESVLLDDVDDAINSKNAPQTVTQDQIDAVHCALGVGSEAGELATEIVRSIIENRKLDRTNMIEEVGDILWYLAIICRQCDFTLEQAMAKNIEKLKARYPDKFDPDKAVNRDLEVERSTLEK